MEIYLMQHGPNLPPEQDAEQGLSPEGEKVAAAGAATLKRLGVRPDLILTSPKKRARQTAEAVARAVGLDPTKTVVSDKAKAMAPLGDTLELLSAYQDKDSLLVAGHLPNLALVAGSLLAPCGQAQVDFQQGGICRLDLDELPTHSGRLVWYLPPAVLALLAR